MLKKIFCILFFFSLKSFAVPLPNGAYSMPSFELNAPNDDLEPFYSMMNGATLVALGESIHTNGLYHLTNARITKFLIEKKASAIC